MFRATLVLALVVSSFASAQTLSVLALFPTNGGQEYPESIAIDAAGNLLLPLTFSKTVNKVSPLGLTTDFATVPDKWLLGTTIDGSGNLVVVGQHGLWKVSPAGVTTKFSSVTGQGSLNDVAFDGNGNAFITDDTYNQIWKVDAQGNATVWSHDPKFQVTSTVFPIAEGCNGIAFSPNFKTVYVTNTSEGTILALDVNADGSASPARVVVASPDLIGIDGIRTNTNGDLYVAQNLNPRILKVSKQGQVTVLAAGGLLSFPTSLVIGRDPTKLFICNNGNAFFSNKAERPGVLVLDLAH